MQGEKIGSLREYRHWLRKQVRVWHTRRVFNVFPKAQKKKEQGRRGTSLIHKSGEGTEREQNLTGITANIPSESFTWRRGSPIIHAATCIAAAWRKRLSVRAS